MLFNSFEFIFLFAPCTFMFWIFLRTYCFLSNSAVIVLLLASLLFYAYWNPPFIFLLLASVFVNYVLQRCIYRYNKDQLQAMSKVILYIGVSVNILFIAYFKYKNFILYNVDVLLGRETVYSALFLPLGISFFTFQQIACLVDTYKGKIGKTSLVDYALFVSFFPQLIAGPIVKYEELIPQIRTVSKDRYVNWDNIRLGLVVFACGLCKKIAIADYLSPVSVMLFDSKLPPTFYDSVLGTLAYTMQLYFDFSGYSDMALGLGFIFGVTLPQNFASPYQSLSIIDFWRRWHMTLSGFLKDYVYIPLGGNQGGQMKKYINLLLTMLIGGLWHGAGWNYVLWGGLHGIYLVINHVFRCWSKGRIIMPRFIGWVMTFSAVSFAWIFFRAPSIDRAVDVIDGLASFELMNLSLNAVTLIGKDLYKFMAALAASIMLAFFVPNVYTFLSKIKLDKYYVAAAGGAFFAVSLWLMTYTEKVREFLYFQF